MDPSALLRIPFALNIVILVPVVWSMLASPAGTVSTFEGKVPESDGLRLLVASLWFGILVCSALALIWPKQFIPLLTLQVIYKATWLAVFVLPLLRDGGWAAVPQGIASVFFFIVLVWPLFIWAGLRGSV